MQVLLVHGLSRTPASLLPLAWRLQTSGWQTHAFGYAAIFETFDQIVERLRHQLHDLSQQGPYSVVAHSLGGCCCEPLWKVSCCDRPPMS